MAKYIIIDWAHNHVFKDQVFSTQEEGFDFIADEVEEEDIEEFLVVGAKEYRQNPLSVIDMLEGRSCRTQL